jgi:hypothetical protein
MLTESQTMVWRAKMCVLKSLPGVTMCMVTFENHVIVKEKTSFRLL